MVKQEGIRDIVLSEALQIEDEAELVIDLVACSQLLQFITSLLPELWEADGRDEDPGTALGAPFDH